MTKSKDGAPHLRGKLVKVGHLALDFGVPGFSIDNNIYTFDGYNTESGDREDEYTMFIKLTDTLVLADTSLVYDIVDYNDDITDRVVVIGISY